MKFEDFGFKLTGNGKCYRLISRIETYAMGSTELVLKTITLLY